MAGPTFWAGHATRPQTSGLVLMGIMMRFAERILGCRLEGYMCREFVGTPSCVRAAGRRGYDRTA